ncbi:MAG TPA: hypothetical protein VGM41_11040 [Chitinophagaceae bacterium]|jgi:hypothetical protein
MNYTRALNTILLFLLVVSAKAQENKEVRLLHFTSSHTSFPDTARARGHLYDSVLYTASEHYSDSSVLLIVPPQLQAGSKVDLVFWFHGWRNTIDTAAEFYSLTRQFIASHRNAVLVLAETAKNAPDSYGGKLEQPGMFSSLVKDVMNELKKNNLVPRRAEPGNIVLAGHSGAFRVIAYILQNGQAPVQEVFLFDALYSQVDKYMDWIKQDAHHHFVHWFTNHGGGTDKMSDTMMQQLKDQQIGYALTEEAGVQPADIKNNRVLFVHSLREHNVIINNPDDFLLLLENSFVLLKK